MSVAQSTSRPIGRGVKKRSQSAGNQQEVTDRLGYQVRRAVEVMIQSFNRADQDRQRELLRGIGEGELYEAALTVMMRLVFLFCAEERDLLDLHAYDLHRRGEPAEDRPEERVAEGLLHEAAQGERPRHSRRAACGCARSTTYVSG